MKIETDNLILLSTYVKSREGCGVANVYKYIHKYNVIQIDKYKFIDKTNPFKIK